MMMARQRRCINFTLLNNVFPALHKVLLQLQICILIVHRGFALFI